MKIKEGFKLRTLGRDYIVIGEGTKQVNFNAVISLNETAAFLWNELLGKDFDIEEMAKKLTEQYEVDVETARKDSSKLAEDWIKAGLVTE